MNHKLVKLAASSLLIAGLMAPALSVHAASEHTAHVKVRVVGPNGFSKTEYVSVGEESYQNTAGETIRMDKPNALGALVDIAAKDGFAYKATTSQFGVFVDKIGDIAGKSINDNTSWLFWINGEAAQVGADQAELHDGDEVVWGFSDYTQTLYPKVQISNQQPRVGDTVQVKVTAQKTTYDANWNATVTTVPVEGASVNGEEVNYLTDKDGVANVKVTAPGLLTLKVDKVDPATGLPLLIRTGDLNLLAGDDNAKFSDLDGYDWAKGNIMQFAHAGMVVGDGAGHFEPGRAVTRGELAKMIAPIAGGLEFGGEKQFSDVASDDPCNKFIQSVERLGIMTGDAEGTFRAGDPVTREELAIIIDRLTKKAPLADSTLAFDDAAQVSDFAKPYVAAAVKSGHMKGNGDDTFRPKAYANRAEVAVVLGALGND
ncbi:S-layer homology domain-containing protein [Tumebacillus flagellatus]|uniref:SLH domain-containing protein n=1 Tax=Tumebacillus flagellatus TaxID=1157490 RepID=A0A074MFF4_9BACL|nr:S-layer homology domain-containing protein [Tumebacillus flagellatus]KEO84507.1 hypothetical protein EL26_03020 [Tumebacillus flagellatus]